MSSPSSPNPNRPPSSASSASSKAKICHFYLRSKCKRGSSCPDLHPSRVTASKKPICPHHLKGKCVYGTGCSRSHGQPSSGMPQSPTKGRSKAVNGTKTGSDSKLKPKPSRGEIDEAHAKGKAKETEDLDEQSEGEVGMRPSFSGDKGVCVFYGMGACSNDACDFKHEEEGQSNALKKQETPTPFKPKSTSRSTVCKYDGEPGGCKKGPICEFKHSEPSSDAKRGSKSSKTSNLPEEFPAPVSSWADDVQAEEDRRRDEEEDEEEEEEPVTAGRNGWDRPADDDDEGSDGPWGYKGQGWAGGEPEEEREEEGDGGDEDQVDEQLQEENLEVEEEDPEVEEHGEHRQQQQTPEGTGLNGFPSDSNGWPAPSSVQVPLSPAPVQSTQIPQLAQPTQYTPAAPPGLPSTPMTSVVSAPSVQVQGVISPSPLQPMASMFPQTTQPMQMQNPYALQQQQQQQQQQLAAAQMQMQLQQPFLHLPMSMQMPGMMPGMPGMSMGSQIPGMPQMAGMPMGSQMPGMPQMAGMSMGSQLPGMPQMSMGMPGMPMGFPLTQPFIMPNAQPQPTTYMDLIPEAPPTMHWSEYADPFADAQKPFCKLHSQGRCTQGQLCTYRHALTVQNFMMLYGETQPTLKRLVYGVAQVPITFPTTAVATQVQPQIIASPTIVASPAPVVVAAPPPEPAPSPAPATRSAKPSAFDLECKFYPIGKCKNGTRCPFKHTQHPPERTQESYEGNGNYEHEGEDWSFTAKPHKINAPCRYHVEKGYCNNGEDCRFMHEQNGNVNGSSAPSGPQSIVGTDVERESADTGPTTNGEDNGWGGSGWDKGGANGTSGWDEPVKEETHEGGGGNTDQDQWGAPTDQSGWGVSTASRTDAGPRRGGRDWMSGRESESGGSRYRSGPPRSRGVCYSFQEGRCRRGDSCRFSHDSPTESPGNTAEDPQGNGWGDGWGAPQQEGPAQATQADSGWGDGFADSAAANAIPPEATDENDLGVQEQVQGHENENIEQTERQEELTPEEPHLEEELEVEAEAENKLGEVESEAANTQDEIDAASEVQPTVDNDNHNGWAEEWSPPQETSNIPFIKRKVACMAFGQGFCSRGEDCSMMHIGSDVGPPGTSSKRGFLDDSRPTSPLRDHEIAGGDEEVVPEVELEPLVFEHPEVKRHIDSASVTFGPDAMPLTVQTVADMSRIRVFNLPVGTSVDELSKLVSPYDGKVRQDDLSGMQDGASFQIDFADSIDARQAFEFFSQQQSFGRDVIASHPKWRIRRPQERITIRVSWPKPSDMGWAHYSTVTKAKDEAKRLDGVVLNGRRLKTKYHSPKKSQKDNFAVEFANLAVGTTEVALKEICQDCKLVTLLKAVRYDEDPYEKVEEELARFGEHIPDRPPDIDYSAISTVFATFRAESFASDVSNALNGAKYPFLDNAALNVELVHFARYRVPRLLFDAIQTSVILIQEKGEGAYKLQVDMGRMNIVTVFLSATSKNFDAFAAANAELNNLLQGDIVTWGDDLSWNDYFDTEKSGEVLTMHIQPKTNGFIHRNPRGKVIRHFGSHETRAASKEAILKLVKKIEDSRYETEIPRNNMRSLVHGGFDDLLKDFGANKLSFDVFGCKIIVRGLTEDLSKVSDFLQSSETSSTPLYKRGCCEICHYEPQEPIALSCRHVYCSMCLKLAIQFAGQAPLHCVALHPENDRCGITIDYILIKQALDSKAEEDQFLQESFFDYVRRGPDFFFCPSIDCKRVYRAGNDGFNIYCSWCNSELCSFCRGFAHVGKTCIDIKLSS